MNINFYVVVPAVVLSHLIAFGIGLVINVMYAKAVAMFFFFYNGWGEERALEVPASMMVCGNAPSRHLSSSRNLKMLFAAFSTKYFIKNM